MSEMHEIDLMLEEIAGRIFKCDLITALVLRSERRKLEKRKNELIAIHKEGDILNGGRDDFKG